MFSTSLKYCKSELKITTLSRKVKTGFGHWILGFEIYLIPKLIGSRFRVQGSKVATDGPAHHIDQDPEYPTYPIG
jgi:hypothetical protein